MVRIGSLVVMLGVSLSACGTSDGIIPREFVGAWDLGPTACADQDGVTRLSIEDGSLAFYEAHGTFRSVRPDGKHSVALTMDWYDVDEDDAAGPVPDPRRVANLTLSEDRNALTFAIDGRKTTYIRCERQATP